MLWRVPTGSAAFPSNEKKKKGGVTFHLEQRGGIKYFDSRVSCLS